MSNIFKLEYNFIDKIIELKIVLLFPDLLT